MSWADLTRAYRDFYAAETGSADAEKGWRAFEGCVSDTAERPPYHISLLFDRLEAFRGDRPRASIVILDHGCGSALTLFYLAVLGYTNFWGVDVGGDFATRNEIARRLFGHPENRLSVYDGTNLPLPNACVDVVFSQQVIEHLSDTELEPYYREEARVLKSGGLTVHYVPHRLVPYDSHTKTWLIHYLPGPLYRGAAKLFGSPVPDYLFLRWPWTHKALLRRHIGRVEDVTTARFATLHDADNYDGSLRLRNLIARAMQAPLFGPIFEAILGYFVMLETVCVKS